MIIKMIFIISTISYALVLLFNLISYIPRLRGWFAPFKPQEHLKNEKQNKIAIVIPARNESKVIGELFNTIIAQTYPKDKYGVYVVVKEEDDPTIEMTNKIGGKCFVVKEQNCKGDALDYCFKKILKDEPHEYQALVIVDADCLLDKDFLTEMNNSMASGRQVFQAKKLVKNYLCNNKKANSWAASCNGLIWTLIDDMGNRYKSDKNYTNMTVGTGVMLSMPLVKKLGGWPYKKTVTEDMEFMNDCAIRKIEGYYNSYCVMYVEEATSLKVTNLRRTRWLKGLIDSNRIYRDQLDQISEKRQKKNRYFVDALLIVFRYIGCSVFFSIFQAIFAIVLLIMQKEEWMIALSLAAGGLFVIYLSFFIMTVFCLLIDGKHMKLSFIKKIFLLFTHPLFYMGYIPIIAKALLTPVSSRWDAIERIDFKESEEASH